MPLNKESKSFKYTNKIYINKLEKSCFFFYMCQTFQPKLDKIYILNLSDIN